LITGKKQGFVNWQFMPERRGVVTFWKIRSRPPLVPAYLAASSFYP
jgi:hypothetical protein